MEKGDQREEEEKEEGNRSAKCSPLSTRTSEQSLDTCRKDWVWWLMLIIPALERQRYGGWGGCGTPRDPWPGSLAFLVSSYQVSKRACLQKEVITAKNSI